jgi:hypothetical protein
VKRDVNAIMRTKAGARRNYRTLPADDGVAALQDTLRVQRSKPVDQGACTRVCKGGTMSNGGGHGAVEFVDMLAVAMQEVDRSVERVTLEEMPYVIPLVTETGGHTSMHSIARIAQNFKNG